MARIETSLENDIGTIVLNDPAKRNALSAALISELLAALLSFEEQHVRVVVLRAPAGATTWSAGHDVHELPTNGRDPMTYNDPLRRAIRQIQEYPGAVIALVEGGVWGGACELAMACDMILAADTATFALTPARLGVPYDIVGAMNLMQSVSLPVIKEMLFRAHSMSAAEAREHGIVNRVVPPEALEAALSEVAGDILRNSPLVVALLKQEFDAISGARPLGAGTFERIQMIRRRIYDSEDYREGIRAFFDKREPKFVGR